MIESLPSYVNRFRLCMLRMLCCNRKYSSNAHFYARKKNYRKNTQETHIISTICCFFFHVGPSRIASTSKKKWIVGTHGCNKNLWLCFVCRRLSMANCKFHIFPSTQIFFNEFIGSTILQSTVVQLTSPCDGVWVCLHRRIDDNWTHSCYFVFHSFVWFFVATFRSSWLALIKNDTKTTFVTFWFLHQQQRSTIIFTFSFTLFSPFHVWPTKKCKKINDNMLNFSTYACSCV